MVKKYLAAIVLACSLALMPTAFAQITKSDTATINNAQKYIEDITPNNAPKNPLGLDTNTIQEQKDIVPLAKTIISMVTGFIAALAGIYAVFMLLRHSFVLITSNGDSKKISEARGGIVRSLLGLVGIMFSYLIIYTIVDTLFKIGSGTGL